ncbi:D-glycero-beta-D-manno-heptose-1,7-bisphosphate 7-phosphatase [Bacterioplanes sanyensis]|uniref:D,D-heptose 1,7-bisphosphate phosphatase n=1 Tax=Bacterioplanes sanyensis TaxID=1249553 RepID=A0A222FHB8_9GAMM|nr:D-glycero-beta-D-manno-heptose 1,7-bisphosphate 7-phosphatase [Bacterioplanes sanyensis]ASP37976.1 D-glycero-beta-D-manno-heptose-1,7-bisphosphate 7-phosphatase [Bacterioplanes sanyensis]
MTRLIILDRDGVLNQDSDAYVKSVEEWIAIDGSAEAVGRLCDAGVTVAVATNQSGLARGYFGQADLDAMHEKMSQLAAQYGGQFAHIAWCPHGPDDCCDCRKPLPGLIEQICTALKLSQADIDNAWMVGDALRDLQAGHSAGCQTALVRTGKGSQSEKKLADDASIAHSPVFDDLATFVDWYLHQPH